MTLYAPLDAAQAVDSTLFISNVRPGGWVKGPKINGALIYMSYNGVFKDTKESQDRANKGEVLTSHDFYFIIAPTMQTSAKKYAWLNDIQCIGKMVSYKNDEYVKYDIFAVR